MFTTKVEIPASSLQIDHCSRIMTLGSCFSDNIGGKLKNAYFLTDINPFGVLYNPVSISNSIDLLLKRQLFTESDIFQHQSLYHSFAHTSHFSHADLSTCLGKLNSRLAQAADLFKNLDVLLITFGTSWVFEDTVTGKVVTNCHKLPANRFVRKRFAVSQIVDEYIPLITKLIHTNPDLKLIFTVSPIRHWKDGAHENNLSKSILHVAVDELQRKFEQVHYFPAYELMMDELRDYRFYASDMLHPSDVAIDYIWQRFSATYFSEETISLKRRLEQLSADLKHCPLHTASDEFHTFQQKVEKRKSELKADYPFLSDRF